MFCPRCGYRMEGRERVLLGGVVSSEFGCVRCNRTFLTNTPRVKTMNHRFKLGESVLTWKEALECPVVSVAEAKRRRDAWIGKRMRRRCIPRFCPKCGMLLGCVREWHEQGGSRNVYGCPSRDCNAAYVQPDKCFMRLEEISADWAMYRWHTIHQNKRLRKARARMK